MSCIPRPVSEDCIFCKIVSGELPSARVYEDEHILAFLDLNPVAKGHTLVIPKGHYPTLLDVPSCASGPLFEGLKRVSGAIMELSGAQGFNCLQNNFAASGQMVFHSHWHIIPRFDNDGLRHWPQGSYSGNDEMKVLAEALQAKIGR